MRQFGLGPFRPMDLGRCPGEGGCREEGEGREEEKMENPCALCRAITPSETGALAEPPRSVIPKPPLKPGHSPSPASPIV